MNATRILNQAQAEAVHSAMCALKKVGGALSTTIKGIRVEETHSGSVQVWTLDTIDNPERYASQSAFFAAYGLETEGQKYRAERRERDEPYLQYGVEETRTGNRA